MLFYFFFNDTATTEIYTLSLHDALPICGGKPSLGQSSAADPRSGAARSRPHGAPCAGTACSCRSEDRLPAGCRTGDRKSTRLNSSHANISYAVFCLKKKNIVQLNHVNIM